MDSSLLDKVEQECYQILFEQRLLYNERWCSSALFINSLPLLRWAGLIFSLLGALLCVFYIVYPSSCPGWLYAELYLLFFIVVGVLFYFLPRINDKYLTWLKNAGGKGCKRLARRCVAKARKLAPYDAEYIIKGGFNYVLSW